MIKKCVVGFIKLLAVRGRSHLVRRRPEILMRELLGKSRHQAWNSKHPIPHRQALHSVYKGRLETGIPTLASNSCANLVVSALGQLPTFEFISPYYARLLCEQLGALTVSWFIPTIPQITYFSIIK